jgi:RIB43A
MLRFTGEDPYKKERTKQQQQQITQWNDEQTRLKNQRIKAEKEADLYVLPFQLSSHNSIIIKLF